MRTRDTTKWETEGTGYDSDPLPHLASSYAKTVQTARNDQELSVAELAETIDVDEEYLVAVEDGKAYSEDIPGSVIDELEKFLSVDITA
jgi:hypothetical protein